MYDGRFYVKTDVPRFPLVKQGAGTPGEGQLVDPDLEHRLAAISEHENRVLRVIVNTKTNPERVVTM
jgi:hypothetical protein